MSSTLASQFLDSFLRRLGTTANEAELRHQLHVTVEQALGISDLKFEREHTDIRRNRVIIECKDRGLFRGRPEGAQFRGALRQLTYDYIPNRAAADDRPAHDYVGILFDGEHLAFAFVEASGQIRVTDLRPFDVLGAATLIEALLVDDRRELTAENFTEDFGPESSLARDVLQQLWNHLEDSLDRSLNRVEMLYEEWVRLFAQVTNLGELGRARLQRHFERLGLPPAADTTRVLFTLHTYHALIFKLLAAEVVLVNTDLTSRPHGYCFQLATASDAKLIDMLRHDIEDSGLFRDVGIANFIEGSFFTWYLESTPTALVTVLREVVRRLNLYRLSGLSLDRTRDIVKRIYEELVPDGLRHNLGEYFTPEWLVEFALDQAGYSGTQILTRRLLDPTCGSGNFLIHAISRYKEQARASGWTNAAILKGITGHILGIDLNPLAVLATRVNYLLATAELLSTTIEFEIPVYLADAIYAPALMTSASLTSVIPSRRYQIGTRKKTIELVLPEALVRSQLLFGRVMVLMERHLQQHDSENVFLSVLGRDPDYAGTPQSTDWEPMLRALYAQLLELERIPWNSIWCRIVRNYFASVAFGACEYIVGNPPWIRWTALPQHYTRLIRPVIEDYQLFAPTRFFGGNTLDISALIAYSVADKWLAPITGRMAFVIPRQHFRIPASAGFRRFRIGAEFLSIKQVDDFTAAKPWRRLSNKPAVILLSKEPRAATTYPVPYYMWDRTTRRSIAEDTDWTNAQRSLARTTLEASIISATTQHWTALPPGRAPLLEPLFGPDPVHRGHKGILTDLNGAYFIHLLAKARRPDTVQIENEPAASRSHLPRVRHDLELEPIYPLIKGSGNIQPFYGAASELYVIVPNRGITRAEIPSPADLNRRGLNLMVDYFRTINRGRRLEQRSTWRTRLAPNYRNQPASEVPFYAIYDVGPYTFSPYKVVWAEQSDDYCAAVISSAEVPFGGGVKPIVPDHKVFFMSFETPAPAHYLCALLNSSPVRELIEGTFEDIQIGTLFEHMQLFGFDPRVVDHQTLATLSQQAHELQRRAQGKAILSGLQRQIDAVVWRLINSARRGRQPVV